MRSVHALSYHVCRCCFVWGAIGGEKRAEFLQGDFLLTGEGSTPDTFCDMMKHAFDKHLWFVIWENVPDLCDPRFTHIANFRKAALQRHFVLDYKIMCSADYEEPTSRHPPFWWLAMVWHSTSKVAVLKRFLLTFESKPLQIPPPAEVVIVILGNCCCFMVSFCRGQRTAITITTQAMTPPPRVLCHFFYRVPLLTPPPPLRM